MDAQIGLDQGVAQGDVVELVAEDQGPPPLGQLRLEIDLAGQHEAGGQAGGRPGLRLSDQNLLRLLGSGGLHLPALQGDARLPQPSQPGRLAEHPPGQGGGHGQVNQNQGSAQPVGEGHRHLAPAGQGEKIGPRPLINGGQKGGAAVQSMLRRGDVQQVPHRHREDMEGEGGEIYAAPQAGGPQDIPQD